MRLKNKKTGEIVEVESLGHEESLKEKFGYQVTLSWELDENLGTCKTYTSLAELNEEWTDAPKEPKEFYFIDQFMSVSKGVVDDVEYAGRHKAVNYAKKTSNNLKTAGNYFETKEEAELAVRKLKAWKRLRDKGFEFDVIPALGHCDDKKFDISIIATMPAKWWYNDKVVDDIHYVFGGEE